MKSSCDHDFSRKPDEQKLANLVANLATGRWLLTAVLLAAVCLPSIPCWAQDTPDYYRANCMNCHTIGGGRLAGPDLKDVGQRQKAEWLISFMQNPRAVVESGDAYAAKLVSESPGGAIMPTPPQMTRYRAEQILKLIAAESKLEKSQFQGIRVSNKPFTDADRKAGHDIFVGKRKLANSGSACISCHSMHDLSALGGGYLGPDLTLVYERLKGRKALSAWLTSPATETMQPIFKNRALEADEIHVLAAYFEDAAKYGEADPLPNRTTFLLLGLGMATAVIFMFDAIWKGRLQSVRRPLVDRVVRSIHQGESDPTQGSNVSSSPDSSDPHESKRGD